MTALRNRRGGFTLIELIVVISILGILAAFVVPRLSGISPKYRIRSAIRTIGAQIGWARSMAGGNGEEYVLRYDLDENIYWVALPPDPEEDDPDLDIDERETLEKMGLPDHIEIVEIRFPNGSSEETGIVDVIFDAYGNQGSHIVVLQNEEETKMSVKFSALIGVVDYFADEAEFEDF